LPIKKKKKEALMKGLEENKALQEANYMAESESEVGEADVEIDIVPEVEPRRPRYGPWPKWIPRTTKTPLMPSIAI
jgi:hypothetical protein